MSTRSDSRSDAGGFTLVEMLVVLTLVAVTAAVSVSMIVKRDPADARTTAASMTSVFAGARGAAIARGAEVSVLLGLESRQMRYPGDTIAITWPDGLSTRLLIGRELLATESAGEVLFFPDGASTGAELTLDDGKRQVTVRVPWLTGIASRESAGD